MCILFLFFEPKKIKIYVYLPSMLFVVNPFTFSSSSINLPFSGFSTSIPSFFLECTRYVSFFFFYNLPIYTTN